MKKISFLTLLTILFLLLLITNSCLEYKISTKLFTNGKIERSITVKGDSASIFKESSLNLPVDSTWKISAGWVINEHFKGKRQDSVYNYSAKKIFRSYKQLNEELQVDSATYNKIRTNIRVIRKFRWFYTAVVYEETYQKYFPYDTLPIINYMTEEEVKVFFSDDNEYRYDARANKFIPRGKADSSLVLTENEQKKADSLKKDIEKRFESWQNDNILTEYEASLANFGSKKKSMELRDSFELNVPIGFCEKEELTDLMVKLINQASGILQVNKLKLLESEDFKIFLNKLSFLQFNPLHEYEHEIVMPGEIISSNIENKVTNSWVFGMGDFYASDYRMVSESKIVNKQFILFSIIVVVVLLSASVYWIIKKPGRIIS